MSKQQDNKSNEQPIDKFAKMSKEDLKKNYQSMKYKPHYEPYKHIDLCPQKMWPDKSLSRYNCDDEDRIEELMEEIRKKRFQEYLEKEAPRYTKEEVIEILNRYKTKNADAIIEKLFQRKEGD